MSASASLERGYRRLLAWYPREFRREHEEEMLAVLMAGAREDQRRPGLAEAADVVRSALRMRLRRARPGPGNGAWADSLAVFSVAAPLFLLAVDILAVALPYRLPTPSPFWRAGGSHPEIGGLSLLSAHFSSSPLAARWSLRFSCCWASDGWRCCRLPRPSVTGSWPATI